MNSLAKETVLVGDDSEADIRGAKGAGLQAIWKRNLFHIEPKEADVIIDELEELPQILRHW